MSVYFAVCYDGLVKIGYSKDPFKRIYAFRKPRRPYIYLRAILDGDLKTERAMHMRFGRYHSHSEWFRFKGALRRFVEKQPFPVRAPKPKRQKKPKVARPPPLPMAERMGERRAKALWHDDRYNLEEFEEATGWPRSTAYAKWDARFKLKTRN